MAERRMFAKSIIDSDLFLDMPSSTQNLYFHLSMRADDDGFVNSPLKILRMVSCSKNDMDMLIFKNFIIPFDTGICVIKHWRIHNYIRNDRYTPTIYTEEKSQLSLDENKGYTTGIPTVIPVGDVGKVRLGKVSLVEDRKDIGLSDDKPKRSKFIPPTLEEVTAYCEERQNSVDPQKWIDHYTSNGWMVGRTKMKDWKAAVRTWERSEFSKGGSNRAVNGGNSQNPNAGVDFGF
ncbi:hypothetical protein D3P07_11420 [Paenibacillus sp. 1011MAR3C5]|uniref:hypothetical protein n=1 Tax=Paenibacillus sp. 1011MAR3C5 TaxID=1675787 RepID=UPI000E6C3453|nr:hypothetical protein [Paenibacillus sp. 1011MAR3C5]RJE88597.1 hypothetical protein D3P07_11420 [Paenibacillus sp. 1011MAR3C5]